MATEVERMVVSLEASITKFQRTMERSVGITNDTMGRIERRQMTAVQRVNAGWTGMQRGIATAFAGAATLRGTQSLIDASIGVSNALKVAGLAGEELTGVYNQLFSSAQRNLAPIESLATLYGRAAQVQGELGASSADLLKFTDNIAIALRVNGRSAQESSGALLQLGQALGSARVMAEEFNSINEGARPILQAAAAGISEAGGSVAKLKQLVIDGKISNQAFFQGVQAGSVILEDKLVGAEASVAQSFIRLRNVLIDVAGDFNTGTGASASFATSLDQLGIAIENLSSNEDFNKFLADVNDFGNAQFAATIKEFQQIGAAIDGVKAAFANTTSEVDRTQIAASEAQAALEAFASANGGDFTDEVEAAFRDLVVQLIEGRGTAESTREAIMALGTADPNFDRVIGKVDILTSTFIGLRDAAYAALRVATQTPIPTNGGFAGQEGAGPQMVKGNGVTPISAADYPVIGGAGSKSGGGRSKVDAYNDALASQQRRTEELQRETQLQAQLNPLVNDYGFAIERLRAQIELENAAKEAGLPLDEQRQAKIEELATGYANATVAAAQLAEAQNLARQSAEDLANAGRQALDSIIDGFLEGKDAGEVLNSVVKDLGRNLLKMGIDLLGGGMKQGGFNPLGFLGGLFGFASGTANTGGRKGEPRGIVHGQEAVIPLPSGGNVPVDLRMPSLPSAQPQSLQVHIVSDDEKLGAYVTDKAGKVVAQSAPGIVGASVSQANKSAPGAMAKFQQQRGGADYRTM